MDDWRWFETGSGLRVEPWGTPLGTGSGRVKVSGADFLRGRSLGTERDSGASVHMGVVGALAGPVRAQEDRGILLMDIDGGKIPIFWLVASWMVRSNSLTSSIVMYLLCHGSLCHPVKMGLLWKALAAHGKL